MSTRSRVSAASADRGSLLALAALAVALAAVAGPAGVVAAVGVGALRYTLETAAALAGGHVALVALFPGGIDPVSFAIVEAGFLLVLVESASERSRSPRVAAVAVVSALSLGGVAWVVLTGQSLWLAATTLVGLFAVAAYGLHRYEVVRAGQLSEDRQTGRGSEDGREPAHESESTDATSGDGP